MFVSTALCFKYRIIWLHKLVHSLIIMFFFFLLALWLWIPLEKGQVCGIPRQCFHFHGSPDVVWKELRYFSHLIQLWWIVYAYFKNIPVCLFWINYSSLYYIHCSQIFRPHTTEHIHGFMSMRFFDYIFFVSLLSVLMVF